MATLASWDSGTLPTVIGSGVTNVTGGGPSGLCDAIEFAQPASAASTVQFSFSAVTAVTIRAYIQLPASWASASQRLIGGRPSGSTVGAAYTQAGTGAPGQVRLSGSNGGTTVASSSNGAVAVSTWYRFELQTNHSANTARLMVFPLMSDAALYDSGWVSGTYQAATSLADIGPNITSTRMGTIRAAAISVSDSIAAPIGRAVWDTSSLSTPTVATSGTTEATYGASDGTATVSWGAVSGATSYDVYKASGSTPAQGDFTLVATGAATPYTFTGLAPGTYSFGVKAKSSSGESAIGYAVASIAEAAQPLHWMRVGGVWVPKGSRQRRVGGAWIDVTTQSPYYREGWGDPVFLDDFSGLTDGSAPDPTKWHRRGLPSTSDHLLTNTDRQGVIVAANTYIQGGLLTMKTERRSTAYTGDAYTRWYDTAYVDTMPRSGWAGFAQRYGRFECRAKSLHPGDTAGIWPAFWLRTNEDGGENDVFEWVGTPTGFDGDGNAQSYTYASRFPITGVGSFSAFFEQTGQTSNSAGNAYHESTWTLPTADDWHTYACEWTPDRMSNYCDGVLTVEIRRGVQPLRNNGTVNGAIADGALILDGGFGGSAKAHMRLSVHVGFPNVGFASPAYTASPHYFVYDYVAAYAWSGQE